jgi:hypothetical protein
MLTKIKSEISTLTFVFKSPENKNKNHADKNYNKINK